MSSQRILFIDHNPNSGRISKDNARKVWAHVSRHSVQRNSENISFKQWQPQKRRSRKTSADEHLDVFHAQTLESSRWLGFLQSYTSKVGLRNIGQPEELRAFEKMLIIQHRLPRATDELLFDAATRTRSGMHSLRERLKLAGTVFRTFEAGLRMLEVGNASKAFASFEWAFRNMDWIVSLADSTICNSLFILMLRTRNDENMSRFFRVFIDHFEKLAVLRLGSSHPQSLLAQCLRLLPADANTYDVISQARLTELSKTYGSEHSEVFREEMDILASYLGAFGINCDMAACELKYEAICKKGAVVDPKWRYSQQYLSIKMAQVFIAQQRYEKAERLVSDAFDHLLEYARERWMPDYHNLAPLSITMIIWRLWILAQALAGQNNHERADSAFRAAIFVSSFYFQPVEDPVVTEALEKYALYLRAQKRVKDAEAIEKRLDEILNPFDNLANQDDQAHEPRMSGYTPTPMPKVPLPLDIVDSFM